MYENTEYTLYTGIKIALCQNVITKRQLSNLQHSCLGFGEVYQLNLKMEFIFFWKTTWNWNRTVILGIVHLRFHFKLKHEMSPDFKEIKRNSNSIVPFLLFFKYFGPTNTNIVQKTTKTIPLPLHPSTLLEFLPTNPISFCSCPIHFLSEYLSLSHKRLSIQYKKAYTIRQFNYAHTIT